MFTEVVQATSVKSSPTGQLNKDVMQSALGRVDVACRPDDGSLTCIKRDVAMVNFTSAASIQGDAGVHHMRWSRRRRRYRNHAILFKPQWNPPWEEQALSRVHRIGQVKPVHLMRFAVQGFCEEKIVSVQERTRALTDLAVGQGKGEAEGWR